MKSLLLLLLIFALSGANCRKPHHEEGFYFRCKVNGQEYIPNGCTNCITCTIYQDTIFLLGGNRGFEAVDIGIISNEEIQAKNYKLNQSPQQKASYDNSPLVNDIYETDSTHTGVLNITSLDKTNKIISGRFYFKGYNAYKNDSVNVTEGIFRLKYNNN